MELHLLNPKNVSEGHSCPKSEAVLKRMGHQQKEGILKFQRQFLPLSTGSTRHFLQTDLSGQLVNVYVCVYTFEGVNLYQQAKHRGGPSLWVEKFYL